MNFSIGQKVVALTNTPYSEKINYQKRVRGQIYEVRSLIYCPITGKQAINLGYFSNNKNYLCSCGSYHPNNGLMWTRSSEFAPAEEKGETMVEEFIEDEEEVKK